MRVYPWLFYLALFWAPLSADASFQENTQITWQGSREHISVMRYIKGNRMAVVSKNRSTVIDLDKEIIAEIDFSKKTYSIATFAQVKESIKALPQASFNVLSKPTGQTASIGVLSAKEIVVTIEDGSAMKIVVDSWMTDLPGYDEARAFRRKFGEKLGYGYASGLSQISAMPPQVLAGLAKASEELNNVRGVPVEITTKMGDPAVAGSALQPSQQPPQQSSTVSAALGKLRNLRKKNNEPPALPQGLLAEATTELTELLFGPADGSKFDVPAGFKQAPH